MNYYVIDHHQSEFLKEYVHDVYQIQSCQKENNYFAVPTGIIGISIVIEGQSFSKKNGKWVEDPKINIFGMIDKPTQIKTTSNFREIAVGFKPYFLRAVVQEKLVNLTGGETVDATHFFCRGDLDKYHENLMKSNCSNEILKAIEFLLKSSFNPKALNPRIMEAGNLIYHNKVDRVNQLAKHLNISTVALRNMFSEYIGLSPKNLIRVRRINRALKIGKSEELNLTELAYCLGYFDQAHFTRDFKETIGMSPKKYFSDKDLTFDFYNYGRWNSDNFVLK